MSGPEIWARVGRDLSLSKSYVPDTYTFRITDKSGEVTISFEVAGQDLRSLRKWIKDILK